MSNPLYEYFQECKLDSKRPSYLEFKGLNESYSIVTRELFANYYKYRFSQKRLSLNEFIEIQKFEEQLSLLKESDFQFEIEKTWEAFHVLDESLDHLNEVENLGQLIDKGVMATGVAATGVAIGAVVGIKRLIDLFKAKKVKKLQNAVEDIKDEKLDIRIQAGTAKMKGQEKAKGTDKSFDAKAVDTKLKVKLEALDKQIEAAQEEVDKKAGKSKYLNKVKSVIINVRKQNRIKTELSNAEVLHLGTQRMEELKRAQAAAAKQAKELSADIQKETAELKKQSEEEGDNEKAKVLKKHSGDIDKLQNINKKVAKLNAELKDIEGDDKSNEGFMDKLKGAIKDDDDEKDDKREEEEAKRKEQEEADNVEKQKHYDKLKKVDKIKRAIIKLKIEANEIMAKISASLKDGEKEKNFIDKAKKLRNEYQEFGDISQDDEKKPDEKKPEVKKPDESPEEIKKKEEENAKKKAKESEPVKNDEPKEDEPKKEPEIAPKKEPKEKPEQKTPDKNDDEEEKEKKKNEAANQKMIEEEAVRVAADPTTRVNSGQGNLQDGVPQPDIVGTERKLKNIKNLLANSDALKNLYR